jgi:hypothetical protein
VTHKRAFVVAGVLASTVVGSGAASAHWGHPRYGAYPGYYGHSYSYGYPGYARPWGSRAPIYYRRYAPYPYPPPVYVRPYPPPYAYPLYGPPVVVGPRFGVTFSF